MHSFRFPLAVASVLAAAAAAAQGPIGFLVAPNTQTGLAPHGVAIADLDGDGDKDAVTANYEGGESGSASVLINRGNGTFEPPVSYPADEGSVEVVLGDFNGDNRPDMLISNQMSGQTWGSRSMCTVYLNNGNGTFGGRRDYDVGFNSWCRGIEVADFDGDGKLDWAAAASWEGNIYVYRGGGDGTFALWRTLPGESPDGLLAADFNNDGRVDLAFHTVDDLFVRINNGSGFSAAAYYPNFPQGVQDLAAADFNKDGAIDLVSTGYRITVFVNNGSGGFLNKFHLLPPEAARGVVTGDFDGDTWPDFATANYLANSASVFYNDGNMGFSDKRDWGAGIAPANLAAGDLDGDSRLDLLVLSSQLEQTDATVILNAGGRQFVARREYQLMGYGNGIDVGDLNRDGYPDVATAVYVSNQDRITVFFGREDGSLSEPYDVENIGNNIPTDVAIGDLNGDGWPDLVASIFSPGNRIRVWLNQGDGTFYPSVSYAAGGNPSGVAIGELNGDGQPDIVCTNGSSNSNSIHVFLNMGNGTFGQGTEISTLFRPSDAVFGDFDDDGDQDFVVTHGGDNRILLFRNSGIATFTTQAFNAGAPQSGGIAHDFNRDGRLDFLTGGAFLKVLFNNGSGFGAPVNSPIPAAYVTASDFDLDGDLDGAGSDHLRHRANFGPGSPNGTFTLQGSMPAGYEIGKLAAADLDHDGFPELLAANGRARSISVFTNATFGRAIQPDALTLQLGFHVSGALPDVLSSDDRRYVARPGLVPNASMAPVTMNFEGFSPTEQPTQFSVVVESSSTHPGIGQSLRLWDWVAGQYTEVDSRMAKTTDDRIIVHASGSLARFIEPGTGRIRGQLAYRPVAPISSSAWQVRLDHFGWRIQP